VEQTMAEKELKADVSGDPCKKDNAGQTGNKTADHVRIAREIYNEAKKQTEQGKK
jgi:hypothetical protein